MDKDETGQVNREPLFQRLHHVGIAAPQLDEALALYTSIFNVEFSYRERLENQGVDIAIGRLPDGGEIELLAPLDAESGVARFLRDRGPGMHHTAYAVKSVAKALAECRAHGLQLIDEVPRPGAAGTTVAFLHPRSTGHVLIELVEVE